MAAYNSILTRIKDLLGDDVTDITGYKDLINAGFNYVVDLIPNNSELWRSSNLSSVASISSNSYQYKVVIVTRTDSGDSVERICKEVPLDYLRRGEDSSSIYYNAGNYKNPIFSFTANGEIIIRPTGGTVAIYKFDYFDSGDDVIDSTSLSEAFGFPEQAEYLGVLKACTNLLNGKMSDAVHDDEDQELANLLNGQLAIVDKSMQEEMQRLGLPHQLVGDGKDEEFK